MRAAGLGGARFTDGLNRTVFGLMAATATSLFLLEGAALITPARSSENDLKLEELGREATGLAISAPSASLISISSDDLLIDQIILLCHEGVVWDIDASEFLASPFSLKGCSMQTLKQIAINSGM